MKRSEEKKIYEHAVSTQHRCQICGTSNDLVCHHVRHGASGRKTYKGNIAMVCVSCHSLIHQNAKKYTPILVQKLNELYDMKLPLYVPHQKLKYRNTK